MLRSLDKLLDLSVLTENGAYGTVKAFYINKEDWTIPFLEVSFGPWIFRRRVIIPLSDIGTSNLELGLISIPNIKAQIWNDKTLDTKSPQIVIQPGISTEELIGNNVWAIDGKIGRVIDLIVEQGETWLVRSLVIKIRNRIIPKKVVIPTLFIEGFNMKKSTVYMNLMQDTIRNSPEFDKEEHINKVLDTPPYRGSGVNLPGKND